MLKRTITGTGIVAAVYLFLYFSSVSFVMQTAICLLTGAAVYELCKATEKNTTAPFTFTAIVLGLVLVLMIIPNYGLLLCVAFPALILLFSWMMKHLKELAFDRPIKGILLIFFTLLLLKSVPALAELPYGTYYLTMAVTLCFVTDVAAYLVGCSIGRHKLLPSVSPNKTVEGAVGGILFAVAAMLTGVWYMETIMGLEANPAAAMLYGVLAGIVGEFGDLAMSCIKRIAGIKDFGKLFPGHGGVLDRFDSHLFVVAFTLVFCTLCGGYLS